MGQWNFSDDAIIPQEKMEGFLDPVLRIDLLRIQFRNKLAEVIQTSYQPTDTEEKPSDQASSIVSALLLKYISLYYLRRRGAPDENFELLSHEEQLIPNEAIDDEVHLNFSLYFSPYSTDQMIFLT